jgi:cytochrome d ubiquinol oxidase subunit II
MAEVTLALALLGLAAYVVLGGADFGGGLWDLTAGGPERGAPLRTLIERSISPVWEANHVWLPFILVVLWTGFPTFFGSIMSTLYVPMFGAAAGIIMRGTAFAFRPHATTLAHARLLGAAFALSSVLVPFCFGAAVGGIASGRVPVGNAAGDTWSSWLNPTSITIGVLAVLVGAYQAAVFLAGDAERIGDAGLEQATRSRALLSGALTGAVAIGALFVVRSDARDLYDGLTSGAGLALVAASAVLGIATLALVAGRRFAPARFTSAAAVGCVIAGWGAAQSPYLLPGHLTLDQAAANNATLTALVVCVVVFGALVLLPSLLLLYRLVLRGRLDKAYEPMDTRWRT